MRVLAHLSKCLLFVLVIATALAWLVTRVDLLWPYAVESTQADLVDNLGLAMRLRQYAFLGQTLSEITDAALPGIGSLADMVKWLKETDVWDKLIGDLPGPAQAGLSVLAILVEDIAELRQNLIDLQQLSGVAAAIETFEGNPSQPTLEATVEAYERRELGAYATGPQALAQIAPRIDSLAATVYSLDENLAELLSGLQEESQSDGLTGMGARYLYQLLQGLSRRLIPLNLEIQELKRHVHQDADILWRITSRTAVISTIDGILRDAPLVPKIRSAAKAVMGQLSLVSSAAVALLVAWIGFSIGASATERRGMRRKAGISEVRVIVESQPWEPERRRDLPARSRLIQSRAKRESGMTPISAHLSRQVARRRLSGHLLQRRGYQGQRAIDLPYQGKVIIGSGAGCDIRLNDPLVSKYHAAVSTARTCYFVQNLESKSGTFVNGQPVSGAKRLNHGDTILVGSTEFILIVSSARTFE